MPPLTPIQQSFEIININAKPTKANESGFLKIANVVGGVVQQLPQQQQATASKRTSMATIATTTSTGQTGSSSSSSTTGIKISNVMTIQDDSPSTTTLKPWTKNQSNKSQQICDKMLRDISLFAVFKCMGATCFYTTNDADMMLRHLREHDKRLETDGNSEDTTSWLECAYCEELVDSCTLLVKHIQDEHAACIFQCPYCFYRSCAAHNIIVHLKLHHKDSDQFVFVCTGKPKLMSTEWPVIFRSRAENVRALTCGEGELFLYSFYIFGDWRYFCFCVWCDAWSGCYFLFFFTLYTASSSFCC